MYVCALFKIDIDMDYVNMLKDTSIALEKFHTKNQQSFCALHSLSHNAFLYFLPTHCTHDIYYIDGKGCSQRPQKFHHAMKPTHSLKMAMLFSSIDANNESMKNFLRLHSCKIFTPYLPSSPPRHCHS